MNIHFSSMRLDWKTPIAFYEELNKEFKFVFDPCPSNPEFDGLTCDWGNCSFVNPPYGREIGKWIKKGFEENQKGKTVVFLIPSRTDTRWWHDYIMLADEIRFIKGRLHFDERGPAPFPSAVVVFLGKDKNGKEKETAGRFDRIKRCAPVHSETYRIKSECKTGPPVVKAKIYSPRVPAG